MGAETIGPAYTAGAAASRRVIAELYFMMLMKSCCTRWNGKGKTKKEAEEGYQCTTSYATLENLGLYTNCSCSLPIR